VAVRGGDASRGRIGVTDALPLQLADIAIDGMGLAAAWLAGEEDARAGPEQSKRLVLGHAICDAFLRAPEITLNPAIDIMLAVSGAYLT
jgi:hypothetical protein